MEGDLLDDHQADSCEMDDRRIDHLVFKRTSKPASVMPDAERTPATKSQKTAAWGASA